MSDQKRLFLLDAYALIFRGYYAFIKNPRINSKGLNTSAILGFMNALLDVIKREKPDHLAVCFDKGGSDLRNELYADYKANRDATPEPIQQAIPYIHEILKAMHIPIIEVPGFEADDIIGTLAKQAETAGYKTYMVTPDKDFAQLVSDNILMYRPSRMGNGVEIWGVEEVKKKFGVERPEQVIDFLGMMGDSSDNIPGLPGVGEKTAKKFLAEFGSMENLLSNTGQLSGKMKENVENNKDLGLLSKKLATILTDCAVIFDEKDFELSMPDGEKVSSLFEELEFRRMKEQFAQIFSTEPEASIEKPSENKSATTTSSTAGAGQYALFDADGNVQQNIESSSSRKKLTNTAHLYQWVKPGLGMQLFLEALLRQTSVCFDTETTSLNPLDAELVGIAFSWQAGKGYYISIPENTEEAKNVLEQLKPFFGHPSIEKIGQNLKYDLKVLSRYHIDIKGPFFDTMLAHYLINPDMRHNMDVLAETYLNYSPIPITELLGKKGKNQLSMRDISLEKQTEYAVEDADITFQLKTYFEHELNEAHTEKLFKNLEIPLMPVLASMELEGIAVDVGFLNSLSKGLETDLKQIEARIYQAAGETFNIASPKQLGDILFGKLSLVQKPKKTRTGQFSTAEDVLSDYAKDHEIIRDVLEYRGLSKLKSTYVDALPMQVNSRTGRIHTEYLQTVAATGRLSSNNPNLQNIPIRTERGRQVRKAFIPRDENYVLLAADYSQIELRIIAALSKEPTMIEAFAKGEDIHAATAARIFNIPIEAVTREQRNNAKTVNFGIIYGVSAFGLSNQTDLTRKESKQLIDTYYETYPKLREYIAQQINFAQENGYVQTVLGRRRYLKDIQSQNPVVRGAAERNAVNAPIQGSAADIIKVAMIDIHQQLKQGNFKTKMLLQVHDELVFDAHKDELVEVQKLIRSAMENAHQLSVPLVVDMGIGNNWLEAH
ncbi:MAG: DNA polymerase I [Flavobacteriaceae bacterium]|nr:DNA polymerase I [Flavobacteriaceae bacterium]